ncbi:hypothetical protein [Burkholderia ubonensis]|uniref:hypothetical protein n=1 Tax=Burkholderia ubonensis TaxID=101571 RepID=UPI000B2C6C9D|nr:hypothetical protein [Burkholderia ubonensis]
MSRYVLVFRGPGEIPQDELRLICGHVGVRLLDMRPSKALVLEVDGPAGELLADVRKLKHWVASEQRSYSLA